MSSYKKTIELFVQNCSPGRIPEKDRGDSGAHDVTISNQAKVVKNFYDEQNFAKLESILSVERLEPYLSAVRANKENALKLYELNSRLSAAFYKPLQVLEISVRNSMNKKLSERYSEDWYNNRHDIFHQKTMQRIKKIKTILQEKGSTISNCRIVSTLPFGFWVSLLNRDRSISTTNKHDYEMTLWRPVLRRAFPYGERLTRKKAYRQLNESRILRNRIAHHEPIFERDLTEDYVQILEIIGWVSPLAQEWTEINNSVQNDLNALSELLPQTHYLKPVNKKIT